MINIDPLELKDVIKHLYLKKAIAPDGISDEIFNFKEIKMEIAEKFPNKKHYEREDLLDKEIQKIANNLAIYINKWIRDEVVNN